MYRLIDRTTRLTGAAVVTALLMSAIIGFIEGTPAVAFFSCLLCGVGWLSAGRGFENQSDRSIAVSLFGWGFALRTIYTFSLYYWLIAIRGDPFLGGGDDAEYEMQGLMLLERWSEGNFSIPVRISKHPAYPYLNAAIRYAGEVTGGYHLLLPRLVNVCIGALVAPFCFVLGKNCANRQVGVLAGVLAAIYPRLIFYSGVQLRDIIIVFLFVFSMAHLSRFFTSGRISVVLLAILCAIPMFFLRTVYGYVLILSCALGFIACLVVQGGKLERHIWQKVMLLGLVMLIVYGYMRYEERKSTQVVVTDTKLMLPLEADYVADKITSMREHHLDAAESSSLARKVITRVPQRLSFIVLPMIAFLMPYPPWLPLLEPDPLGAVHLLNNASWTLVMPLSLIGLWVVARRRYRMNVLTVVPLIGILSVSGAGGFNLRYKLPMVPFALVLGAVGIMAMFERKDRGVIAFYLAVQFGLAAAYYIAKFLF